MNSKPRYDRSLHEDYEKLLLDKYDFLLDINDKILCSTKLDLSNSYAIDVQIRRNNELMYYHGGTCILTAKYNKYSNKITFKGGAYAKRVECCKQFQRLQSAATQDNLKKMKTSFIEYLKATLKSVSPKFSQKGSEGYWEQKLSLLWGSKAWKDYQDWLIIDRQAVLEFETKDYKREFYNPFKFYNNIGKKLYAKHGNKWKKFNDIGDELDLLAIGKKQEIVCIEIKSGCIDKNFYYAPLQAALYGAVFEKAVCSISEGIKKLVEQKIELGLLPEEARKRLPVGKFSKVNSILLIKDASELSTKSKVWERLAEAINELERIKKPPPSVLIMP